MSEALCHSSIIQGKTGSAVWLCSLAVWLPAQRTSVSEAIDRGLYRADRAEKEGYHSLAIGPLSAVEMGLKASQAALAACPAPVDEIAWLSYSTIHDNGVGGFWTPAAYIQRETKTHYALPISISHGCNSLMIAALTASKVIEQQQNALIISAEKFADSGFDRWSSDLGVLYGDAAVAAVLSKREGFACIRYMDILSVPELEGMHRGQELAVPSGNRWDIAAHKKAWMAVQGKEAFFAAMRASIDIAISRLAQAGFARLHQHAAVIFPFVGKSIVETLYEPAFGPFAKMNMKNYGYQIGHTGPGDPLLGLSGYLLQHYSGHKGETVLLIGVGAGFSLSVTVLEITGAMVRSDDQLTVICQD